MYYLSMTNNFFTLKDSFTYIKKDLIGAIVIFVVGLMVAAPVSFFGTLSGILFLLVLLIIKFKKRSLGKLEINLFQLTRMALLVSVLGEVFVLGISLYNSTLFSSFRLLVIVVAALTWALVSYKLVVKFTQDLEKVSAVDLKVYKIPIIISFVTYLLPLALV